MHTPILALTVGFLLVAIPAVAFEPRSGCIVAAQACEARSSIRRSDNPGDVHLEIGRSYPLLGANKAEATHFQIVVPGASPEQRWIPVDCGSTNGTCQPSPVRTTTPREPSHPKNVLAVSWQPAFCEISRHRPECREQSAHRLDAASFSLHGLWPEPRSIEFCGVDPKLVGIDESGRWDLLPRIDLDPSVRDELEQAMPGVRSMLDRHEWIRHGSCYSRSADEYFREALDLLAQLNESPVRTLVASRIGKRLTLEQLRATFDSAFGTGAGDRVRMDCDQAGRRTLVTGLRLNLSGEVTEDSTLAGLLADAGPVRESCEAGIIDPAGWGG